MIRNISLLIVCALFFAGCDSGGEKDASKQTSLPIKGKAWQEIDLSEEYGAFTKVLEVLELEHGWLVFRTNGIDGGMAFVPKSEASQKPPLTGDTRE